MPSRCQYLQTVLPLCSKLTGHSLSHETWESSYLCAATGKPPVHHWSCRRALWWELKGGKVMLKQETKKKGHLQGSLDCVMSIVLAEINYSGHSTENIVFLCCVQASLFPLRWFRWTNSCFVRGSKLPQKQASQNWFMPKIIHLKLPLDSLICQLLSFFVMLL